jgi:acyl-CoA synthetase (AMP-forming)/AMP-acid ligase II
MLLERSARRYGTRPALEHGDRVLNYAQLRDEVRAFAAVLYRRGLRPGDRVAILQRNGVPLVQTLLACFHSGLVAVPVNARSTPHEVSYVAADAEPKVWIHDGGYAEHVAGLDGIDTADLPALIGAERPEPYPSAPDAPAWLFYTSGTTGRMKGATLTHRNLLAMVQAYLADIESYPATARVLHAAPLTHGSGLYLLPPLARGAHQVITTSASYDPDEVLDRVAGDGITDIAFLAPTMVKRLVEAQEATPRRVDRLSNVVYGGAPMYVDDITHAISSLGPVFTQIYGQAEAPVTISRLTRAQHGGGAQRLLSAGTPYLATDVAVRRDGVISATGEGEILARGDVVMSGYWRDEEATATALAGGWLHTGDIGRIDEDGYLYLLDRNKDVIISGGANIYPREVEEVILEHPLVREVAVLGAPDEQWGERVVAVIALADDAPAHRERVRSEVEAACRRRLSGYKLPRQFDWTDALPKSPYGKVLKRELRETYWRGHDRRI